MAWKLEQVEPIDCIIDDSGVYTVIHRVAKAETHKEYSGERILVRVDVMVDDGDNDEPIRSFIGNGNDVRKAVIAFLIDEFILYDNAGLISAEHASYIGYEIARAEADTNYVQD